MNETLVAGNLAWGRWLDRSGVFWSWPPSPGKSAALVAHVFASGFLGLVAARALFGFAEGATFPGAPADGGPDAAAGRLVARSGRLLQRRVARRTGRPLVGLATWWVLDASQRRQGSPPHVKDEAVNGSGRRGSSGCPQESPNQPQAPPRNGRAAPIPFSVSSVLLPRPSSGSPGPNRRKRSPNARRSSVCRPTNH
jgi:hypothetical protein